ncbi:MAG: 2OG-Fe(II) oxygenase [Pirellulales bacterium]|nr:2OG-Fe(II) oxygenase [Pirellulales bacterium]
MLVSLFFYAVLFPAAVISAIPFPIPGWDAFAAEPVKQVDQDGDLAYSQDDRGNRIPDFSYCGYAGGDREIPNVPIRVTIEPAAGDDGERIQAAMDYLASLPLDALGFRGALLLAPGQFELAGQLRLAASGIVLRGSGAGKDGTTLIATGTDRRALIRIAGGDPSASNGDIHQVIDPYVPVGSVKMQLNAIKDIHVGDTVLILRPSTKNWIQRLGMDQVGTMWKPGTRDIRWNRIVTDIQGNTITVDAPITTAIEQEFGGAMVQTCRWGSRIENVGVEDLKLVCADDQDHPSNEDHAWFGITMENAHDAWIRRIEFRHHAGGAVLLRESTQRITVEDCIALAPLSELGGYRRHTFFTQGQQTLFLRCWSESGRCDFSAGQCAAGPNAFVHCHADRANGDSGPIESWASGVLYDNVRIDGGGLHLTNRWNEPPRAGWAAANCVIWQCQAATMHCDRPPTANNWAIGVWADVAGDGVLLASSDFVRPISLLQAQLRHRLGDQAASRIDPLLLNPIGSTNPTSDEAARFVERSNDPPRQLIDVIRQKFEDGRAAPGPVNPQKRPDGIPTFEQFLSDRAGKIDSDTVEASKKSGRLSIHHGWIAVDGRLKTGGRLDPTWWRGSIQSAEAAQFGPSITRFAPGRVGIGLTDDLDAVANGMIANRIAAYDHHYGLWYDRRRDDHLMVRRSDGTVAPPFYEQPFARSGTGTAWDGLSQYDLASYNPWYWNRLHEFAQRCDREGLALFHQNYFQHNILEAGAHWADAPWRPVNNINATGFPEPPPYIGDKRIFIAHLFYDTTNARRREIHRAYIRQCLNNFSDCTNVIQLTGAEFTGPAEFVQFWIDVIAEWEQEHHCEVFVGLSCTKDVQDTILADPQRSRHVDLIDIRYWTYQANGALYAPRGGIHLAPRQHMRQLRPEPSSFASIVKAVREYRTRYPDKAILYNADECCRSSRDGWAVLMGGGSLPDIPALPASFEKSILSMQPLDGVVEDSKAWCLGNPGDTYLIYWERPPELLHIKLPVKPTQYRIVWIDPKTGEIANEGSLDIGRTKQLQPKSNILWLSRKE